MLLTLCVANLPIVVRVFGVPTTSGCDCGTKGGTWRDATEWVARSLKMRFGDQVRVEYFDLFLDALNAFPQVIDLVARGEAKPPLVFVGDELLSAGERISGPAIRRQLEALGLA
jgi:disulfide oxidoreductase YuzD